eukprot:CAMPEP_0172306346 /NCGR_PEP_ID=MMETSP1058-20130122/7430_1 /TAXON_ID=83371 /ORGANISM="Detonula confervacea, Strain CCMP 353" /LENGTH=410 /DNA_ID=CAMNT_0013018193 /DNA_START=123 /DNA_END=1351 /DNA_ORIENTATION=-
MTTVKFKKVVFARLAMLVFFFVVLNVGTDVLVSIFEPEQRQSYSASGTLSHAGNGHDAYRMQHGKVHQQHGDYGDSFRTNGLPSVGYFNLSCPFEWSKYSCAYMQHGPKAKEIVHASTEYYLQHIDTIQAAFDRAAQDQRSRRILFTGDSLMRQLFIGIACNAASLQTNLIEHAEIPWKEEWPCHSNAPCFINGGVHGGFDAASIRLVNGMELHFVPHMGFKDDATAETNVLERLRQDVADYGRITFGKKTAMPPGGDHPNTNVDVLVYNVGIHYGPGQARKHIHHFANWIAKPLMEQPSQDRAKKNTASASNNPSRPRTIYVTTPTQHYNTDNGQWQPGMTKESKACVDQVQSNPRAELEKELLTPGVNVDVLLDYDDLRLGKMHVRKGNDCSHYCMPGVPDVVAARLL